MQPLSAEIGVAVDFVCIGIKGDNQSTEKLTV